MGKAQKTAGPARNARKERQGQIRQPPRSSTARSMRLQGLSTSGVRRRVDGGLDARRTDSPDPRTHEQADPFPGPPVRLSIFSFDRPRPFSFRCLEKKMGAESPGNLPAPGKGDLSQKPAPRVPFIRHLPRKRRLPRRRRLLAWARPQFCRPSAGRPAPTFSRFAFF